MNRLFPRALALALVAVMPAATSAQPRGGSRAPAPVSRPAPAPAPRPAAPPPRAAAPSNPGGFNFNRDVNARPAPIQQRPTTVRQPQPTVRQPQPTVRQPQPTVRQPIPSVRRPNPPATFPHAPYTTGGAGPYERRFHGPILRNAHVPSAPWGWNNTVVWAPAPIYWGGGFWGPWAVASLSNAYLLGSINDYQNQLIYPSYQVEPESPGAQLLAAYSLQQTDCGPPNLVVIWGPNNSVICAYPNALVAAGNYEVDPSTLTLISESQ